MALARAVTLLIAGSGARALVQLVSVALLARWLAPQTFGTVAVALVGLRVLEQAAGGVGAALTQRPTADDKAIGGATFLAVGAGLVLSLATLITLPMVAPAIARFAGFDDDTDLLAARPLIVTLAAGALTATSEALLLRALRFRALVAIDVASELALLPVVALLPAGVAALAWGHAARAVLRCALSFAAAPAWRLSLPSADLVRASTLQAAARALAVGAQGLDQAVVARVGGVVAAGVYSRASRISTGALTVSDAVARALFPSLARATGKEAIDGALHTAALIIGAALLPGAVLGAMSAQVIVEVVLGPGWEGAVLPLAILMFLAPLAIGQAVASSALVAQGRLTHVIAANAARFVAVLACCGVGAALWGSAGAALGMVVVTTLRLGWIWHAASSSVTATGTVQRALRPAVPMIGAAAAIGAAVMACQSQVGTLAALIVLIVGSVALTALAAGAPQVLGPRRGELIAMLQGLRRRASTEAP